jgi:predicted class III extradiol MEMO1 family dioxygenase
MTSFHLAVEEYYRLNPTNFTDLLSLQLTQAVGPNGEYEQVLAVILEKRCRSRWADWETSLGRIPTDQERCERLIQYATNDA